ncbi:MAG: RNase adapter RapZ [Acidobacteria bacterium]|nr:RNase adapter RapZ [Acidobacteriota bacterium]
MKAPRSPELVIITGLSGSGKGTVLKSLEDLGYYSVDNLPIELIPKFAELTGSSPQIRSAALVVDIREGEALRRFPTIFKQVKSHLPTKLIYLDADDATLVRRFSETRRPHPLKGGEESVSSSVTEERQLIEPIKKLADIVINTSRFNVHELREFIGERFGATRDESGILVSVTSFGFRHGVPTDADLVFDVRFLPNPNYIPEYKHLTGKHPKVAAYIRDFPQTREFMAKITDLLTYLLPHYIEEGKSYVTISFGCTGGHHRSVMMAEDTRKRLSKAGYNVKVSHRDIKKS